MKKAQAIPEPIIKQSPMIVPCPSDDKSKLVVIRKMPRRLIRTPIAFLLPKRSLSRKGLRTATQIMLRFTSNEDFAAVVNVIPTYCIRYATPFVIPKNATRRLFVNLKLPLLLANRTGNITIDATRNLRKTNVYASTYCSPTFIAGKEVPHKKPAKI